MDLHWLAGILEGEGCFTIDRGNPQRLRPRVIVQMNDEDVVQRVATLLETRCRWTWPPSHQISGRAPRYIAMVVGPRAARLMEDVLPLMCARRSARIVEILELCGYREVQAA